MKLVSLLLLASVLAVQIQAAENPLLATLKSADDERVAAIIAADRKRLDAIFSDDLRYSHSTGAVDTKASYIDSIMSGKVKYETYEYQERTFTFPAPGIALMPARIHIKSTNTGVPGDMVLCVLAVWREEKGSWRFLAWQSAKIPPAK